MKSLKQHILEGLRINKSSKENINIVKDYNYFPKDKYELKEILKERLKEDPNADLNDIDVSKITNMSSLFRNFKTGNIDVSAWDVSNVTNMDEMFWFCSDFNCDLSGWDVSKVETMSLIFYGCKNFTGEGIETWNTINLKFANEAFLYCEKLNCDLGNWDIRNLEETEDMFSKCESFEGKGLENWDTLNINTMSGMFSDCHKFNCDLSGWDVSKVTNMEYMFNNCYNFEGKGLKNWNIIKCHSYDRMFRGCKKFHENLEKWGEIKTDISQKSITDMFKDCDSLENTPSWYKNEGVNYGTLG